MWKASAGHSVAVTAGGDDDDWETDPDFVVSRKQEDNSEWMTTITTCCDYSLYVSKYNNWEGSYFWLPNIGLYVIFRAII